MTDTLNIHQRILAIMAEVDSVRKEDKKVNNQYTFVSHDAVTALLHPQFVKRGIAVVPTVQEYKVDGNRTEVRMQVAFVNVDDPMNRLEIDTFGFGIDSQDKGPGKAMSYAYKYALLKLFALETHDDPERDSVDHTPKKDSRSPDWIGPLTKTQLNAALKVFRREMEACTDADQLLALVEGEKALFEQCEADMPGWWHGDEKIDFEGWEQILANKEIELSNRSMEGPASEHDTTIAWSHEFRKQIDAFTDLVKLNAHVKANQHNIDNLKATSEAGWGLVDNLIRNKRQYIADAPGGKS